MTRRVCTSHLFFPREIHAALPPNSVVLNKVLWRSPGEPAAPLAGECERGNTEPPPLGVCSIMA